MTEKLEFNATCPTPTQNSEKILLAHGSGGKLTSQLIENIFLPTFGTDSELLHDGAFLRIGNCELAFTTDSYVVQPIFFPGGNIGDLAVNGTVNDLAMCGAHPLYLSCGFILEEGFAVEDLIQITHSMKKCAKAAGIKLVTGDTKVVEKGKGDGLYINTSGIGIIEKDSISPQRIQPGDAIIVNGDIGLHGTAIMSVRESLAFESTIQSDTQELYSLVNALQEENISVHCLRDLTRGGLATALVEIAEARQMSFEIDENLIPIDDVVKGACEFLGLDPLYVACEGRMVAFVAKDGAGRAVEIMQSFGAKAQIIGYASNSHSPMVTAKTYIGTKRILDKLTGDQLPRIC